MRMNMNSALYFSMCSKEVLHFFKDLEMFLGHFPNCDTEHACSSHVELHICKER